MHSKKICLFCKKEYDAYSKKRKFCSRVCADKSRRKRVTSICEFCGKEFTYKRRLIGKQKYCCRQCYFSSCIGRTIKRTGSKKGINQLIKKRDKASCVICGFSRIVELCHIIARNEGGPWEEWNFTFMCPNHHRLYDKNLLTNNEFEKIKHLIENAKNKIKEVKT